MSRSQEKDSVVIQSILDTIPPGTEFSDINEQTVNFVEEGRRSRRIALDSLLKVVKQQQKSFEFSGQFLGVMHWDGNFNNSTNAVVGIIDLFGISSLGDNGLAFVNLRGISGNGLNQRFNSYDTFHAGVGSTQNENGVDILTLFEAWVEYKWRGWTFTGGKLDLVNYFDANAVANDEYSQFLNYRFVNNLAFPVPPNSGALLVSKELTKFFLISASISSNDQNLDNAFDDLFRIIQLSHRIYWNNQQRGAIRAFVYDLTARHGSLGAGVSADYRIFKKLHLYGRYGWNNNDLLDYQDLPVANSYSMGAQVKQISMGDDFTYTVGAAFGQANVSNSTRENSMEYYLRFTLFSSLHISAHYQRIANAAEQLNSNLSIFSLRTRIGF